MHLNSDGPLTSTYAEASGPHRGESHLFTKVSDAKTSDKPIGGEYTVTYATPGSVTISDSAGTFTVAVKKPFKFFGATCDMPATSVISTFKGKSPAFTGTASFYDATTCAFATSDGAYQMHLNSDGTLTSTYAEASGPHRGESHLFTPA
jgi:hypothetical protein